MRVGVCVGVSGRGCCRKSVGAVCVSYGDVGVCVCVPVLAGWSAVSRSEGAELK